MTEKKIQNILKQYFFDPTWVEVKKMESFQDSEFAADFDFEADNIYYLSYIHFYSGDKFLAEIKIGYNFNWREESHWLWEFRTNDSITRGMLIKIIWWLTQHLNGVNRGLTEVNI